MSTFEVPLSPQAQKFLITLVDVQYRFTLKYQTGCGWVLDIADQNDVWIIGGIPLVTGADLLGQYAYLGIGGRLDVATDGNLDAVPTYENLGIESHLYFTTS